MTVHVADEGAGPVVVLLHAFPCDGRLWQPQAAELVADGWRVIVPDLPGFGESALLDNEPSVDATAAAVLDMLDERGVDRCILGGVSLGGYVAMAMLRRRPELAGALLLCGTKATADGDEARRNRERLATLVLESPDDCARILEGAVLPGLLGETSRAARPEAVERVRGWLAKAPAGAVAWYQRAMAQRPDSQAVLADLAVPALVIWGEEDALSPRSEQDLMIERLAMGELAVVPRAGHLAGVERPELVGAEIRRFADLVRGPRLA